MENLKLFEIEKTRKNSGIRYLGNKTILLEIKKLLQEKKLLNKNLIFFDAFCGTGSVSNYFKNEL